MDDEGYRRDIVGCVRLSFKLRAFSLCKFTVSAFCTKTRLFNLGSNGGSLLSDIFRYFYCYCHCTNVDFPTFIVSVSSRGTAVWSEKRKFGPCNLAFCVIQLQWFRRGTPSREIRYKITWLRGSYTTSVS